MVGGDFAAASGEEVHIRVATLEQEEHGLTYEVFAETDVLTWWGHAAHDRVEDEIVERVHRRVLDGMGLVRLHSGHNSKIFKRLMGTTCMLRWREAAEKERVWIVDPAHPIVEGIADEFFEIEHSEMYGEHFDIPQPDELFAISWFEGGRSLSQRLHLAARQGQGRLFQPGPRDISDLSQSERAADHRQRRAVGSAERRAVSRQRPQYQAAVKPDRGGACGG